jgi:Fic family protein
VSVSGEDYLKRLEEANSKAPDEIQDDDFQLEIEETIPDDADEKADEVKDSKAEEITAEEENNSDSDEAEKEDEEADDSEEMSFEEFKKEAGARCAAITRYIASHC